MPGIAGNLFGQRRRVRTAAAVAVIGSAAAVAAAVVPAQAALVRGPVTNGWYGSQPMVVSSCHSAETVGQGVQFEVCITKNTAWTTQGMIKIRNTSSAPVAVKATGHLWGMRSTGIGYVQVDDPWYTCDSKFVPAGQTYYCVLYSRTWSKDVVSAYVDGAASLKSSASGPRQGATVKLG